MRLFFAAPLQPSAHGQIAEIIERLAATGADYKWVEPANLHLTLAFLGEMPEDRLPALKVALDNAARGKAAFTLVFDQVGAFASLRHPRVLWLGASEGAEPLAEIANALPQGQEPGRPFQAHLTLGRQRSLKNLSLLQKAVQGIKDLKIESRIDRIELLRSRLSSKGPAYEIVASCPLG